MWRSRCGVSGFHKSSKNPTLPNSSFSLSSLRSRRSLPNFPRCLSSLASPNSPSFMISSSAREKKFGLDAFLFPLSTPIHASIKKTPSDFEVIELLAGDKPALLSSQQIDHLIEKSVDTINNNMFSIPSNKSEFDTLLLSSNNMRTDHTDNERAQEARLVEKLYQFIEKHKADPDIEPASFSFPVVALPSLSNKHVRRCLFGYLLLQGVQFNYKLTKEPDGTLNVNVLVPSPDYGSLASILKHEATRTILQMKERQVCISAPSEFTLLDTHFLPSEEVLNRFQEVENILRSFTTLRVKRGTSNNGPMLLVRARAHELNSPEDFKFLGFIMRKENIEHQQLLTQLARYLGILKNSITCNGIKDRQAITSQLMCVRFLPRKFQPTKGKIPKSVYQIAAAKLLKMPVREGKVEIGNFCVMERPLILGGHSGNRFRIKLHLSTASHNLGSSSVQELLRARCKLIEDNGFPNYFGLQRFGIEALVGEYVLRGDWLNVAQLVLSSSGPVAADFAKATQQYRKKKWKKVKNGDSSVLLPSDNKETMVESDAVNQDKSDREALYGRITQAESAEEAQFVYSCLPRNIRSFFVAQTQALVFNHVVSRRLQKYGKRVLKGDLVAVSAKEFVSITNEDSVSIFDVLLPLPHARFQLSTLAPEMQTLVNEVCAELGIKWEQFSFEICGKNTLATRAFLLRPRNVTLEEPSDSMAIVAFDLSKGAYATMVLREILGISPMET